MTMNNGALVGSRASGIGAAMQRGSEIVRPLGCCERFFYLYSLNFSVHFCLAAQAHWISPNLASHLSRFDSGTRR